MVQALVVIAVLVAFMASTAATQRVRLSGIQANLRQRRAEAAARSGIQLALATLGEADANKVTLADDWALLGQRGAESYSLDDSTRYRLEIVDCGALVNVNTATEAQLDLLPLTNVQRDSLLDWRETAATSTRTSGAKDDFYDALTQPYNTGLKALKTRSELLLIQGWTPDALLSAEPQEASDTGAQPPTDLNGNAVPLLSVLTVDSGVSNVKADGTGRVNVNSPVPNPGVWAQFGIVGQQAAIVAAGGPYTTFGQLLGRPGVSQNAATQLLDGASFSTDDRLQGRININTAPASVLETVPGITPEIAQSIVAQQSTGFASLGALSTTVTTLTGTALGQAADFLCVGSDRFLVRVWGESGGVGAGFEATIQLDADGVRVLTLERLTNAAPPKWWNWTGETTTTESPA